MADSSFTSPSPVLVSIRCLVYNHEPFLRQCLDGFVMQKTDFRFEAIVHDDASTDGSAAIIREYADKYPDIIKPILQTENQYSKHDGSITRITFEACTGKYIALCEGDDYWTDPLKLQKQVDYMEAHPDCSLCFHNAMIHWYDRDIADVPFAEFEEKDYSGVELCRKWLTPTASFLFRADPIIRQFVDILQKYPQICIGDSPLLLTCAANGAIHGLTDNMCVYGKHSEGWTQYSDASKTFKSARSWEAQRSAFGKEYHEVMTATMTGQYILSMYRSIREPDFKTFFKGLYRGILRQPLTGFRSLFLLIRQKMAQTD